MAKTRDDKIVEFGNDFTAKVGTVITDAQASINGIFDPAADSSVSKIVGGLKNLNQVASPEDITAEILSKGTLKLEFPKQVRDFPEKVIEVLDTMVVALETLKAVLEAIRELIVGISDLLKNLLESIFSLIEDLINMFTSVNCAVRVLPILPIHPSNIDANSYSMADAITSAAFATLILGAYGDTEISKAYPQVPRDEIEAKLLGNFGPSAKYKDGSTGFLAAINDSFEDQKDPNRPTEAIGFSAGIVVHAGAPTAIINDTWGQIKKILTGIKKDLRIPPIREVSPRIEIKEALHTGFDENGHPTTRVTFTNPGKRAPKNLMQLPQAIYLPVYIKLLTVQNTSVSPYSIIREQGEALLREFNTITVRDTELATFLNESFIKDSSLNERLALNRDTPSFSAFSIMTSSFEEPVLVADTFHKKSELSLRSANAEARAVDVLYKIQGTFRKFKLVEEQYKAVEKEGGAGYEEVICFSNTVPLHIPLDPTGFSPVLAEGAAPNWLQYGGTWQIPGTQDIIRKLRDFVNDLKAMITTATNFMVAVVNTYIAMVDKLIMLISRLRNIVLIIDDILNTTIGGNYFTFKSDNGVSGIKKVINDHFSEQKTKYTEARIAGTGVSKIDWFADGESVCGAVIVGTSETAEQVHRLIELFELLFGKSKEKDTSGQKLLSETVLEEKQFTFGQDPATPKNLFTDNFTGVDSSRHEESPENACPHD
jgi:hypothetical protein